MKLENWTDWSLTLIVLAALPLWVWVIYLLFTAEAQLFVAYLIISSVGNIASLSLFKRLKERG